jgi:hypothetical protein
MPERHIQLIVKDQKTYYWQAILLSGVAHIRPQTAATATAGIVEVERIEEPPERARIIFGMIQRKDLRKHPAADGWPNVLRRQ